MVALLDQHDTFIQFPTDPNSVDHRNAKAYASTVTYQQWQGGWLAADGSAIPLFQKPRYYGETFYDQKSRYSLNCQVYDFFFEEFYDNFGFYYYRQLSCPTIY